MARYYKRDGTPVETWAEIELNDSNKEVLTDTVGSVIVSTGFLGINAGTDDKPLIFETTVTGGLLDGETRRYFDETEALKGHRKMLVEASKPLSNEVKQLGDILASLGVLTPFKIARELVNLGVMPPDRNNK